MSIINSEVILISKQGLIEIVSMVVEQRGYLGLLFKSKIYYLNP